MDECEQNRSNRREIAMRMHKVILYILAVSVLSASLSGCAKKKDRSGEESEASAASDSQSSTADRQVVQPGETASQASTPELPAGPEEVAGGDEEELRKQIDEVRRAFFSLQEVCRANDVDGYLDFWDDETKKAVDGRDLDLDERRERRRESLARRPGTLEEIANAKIKSITVDISQAEKIATLSGIEIEGTMMLVRTNGPDLLFHETAQGWKLFTIASGEYFR